MGVIGVQDVLNVLNTDKMTKETAQRFYDEGVAVRNKKGRYSLDTKEDAKAFFQATIGGKVLNRHGINVPYPDIDEEGRLVQAVSEKSKTVVKPSERSLVSIVDINSDKEDDFTL